MLADVPKPRKKRLRKWRIIALAVALPIAALVLLAQLAIGPTIRDKLQAMIAAQLDASLKIGELTYRAPFTVHLYDVHFLAHPNQPGGGTELLSARRIDLSLAKLPLGSGPLIIQRFAIDGLTLHAIRAPDGNYLGLDLATNSNPSPSSQPMKLSDLFRLRHFSLRDASLVYQDQSNPSAAPTQWQGIDSQITLAPQSASLYSYHLDAADEPIARASLDGTIDIDSLSLGIKQFTASVKAPDAQPAADADTLPPDLRELLRKYAVRGTVNLDLSGNVPLTNPQQAAITANIGIDGGGATIPGSGEKLDDLSLSTRIEHGTWNTSAGQIKVQLLHFRAVSGGAILNVSSSIALLDPWTGKWSINGTFGSLDAPPSNRGPWGLVGHADFHADLAHDPGSNQTPFVGAVNLVDMTLNPPGLAAPLQGLTGSLRFAGHDAGDREVEVENLTASYGGDKLALDHAQVALGQLPRMVLISDIKSHLNLVQDAPQCPGDLGPILQTFQPSGPFAITGTAAMMRVMRDDGPGYSPEWDLDIATDGGNLALLDDRLPVTALNGHILATTHAISIPGLSATLLGAPMRLKGNARVVEPISYQGQFNEQGASVEQLARAFNLKSSDGKYPTGQANVQFNFFSRTPDATSEPATQPQSETDQWLSLLGGDGRLQINNGDLWALPALEGLSKHTRIARQALTAGEAAAIFTVSNRTIYYKHLAIYSPALGLQGSGWVTFAGNLNLDIIAAPLGDWKRKLAETNIPIFSSVLASAAGSIEKFVGNATSELLYRFKITGTRDNPQIETIPAPFLTDSAANLFAKMIHHDGTSKLVDDVAEK